MTLRVADWTTSNVDDHYDELLAAYAAVENDPDRAIICPLLNPAPIPTRNDIRRHLATGHRLVESRENGVLTTVQLVVDGGVRACWGPRDPDAMLRAQLDPGGFADFYEAEGGMWLLDTRAPGWVARTYFENYCTPSGPFDTTRTDHPGLNGNTYADHDDDQWTLAIFAGPRGDWMWTVTVL